MLYYVYKITNLINSKVYIGKTANSNPNNRWAKHLQIAKNKITINNQYQLIHKSINKYGSENFQFEIIEECETEKLSLNKEVFWIEKYKSNVLKYGNDFGYNLTYGGEGSTGFKHSQLSKNKMSLSRKGKRTGHENSFYGKTHTKEAKTKIGAHSKGRKIPLKAIEKRSKITSEQVLQIREKYESKNYTTLKDLAAEFKITYQNLRLIILRKRWGTI